MANSPLAGARAGLFLRGGLDADLRTAREQEVEQWRQRDKLPFPEFEEEQEDALRDTLDYPPRGSSQRKGQD